MNKKTKHSSSFRDPSGYVFIEGNELKRCVLPIYFNQYNSLKNSGFFQKAIQSDLLISHEEELVSESEIIIRPNKIPFITYPYEWCFNQYKEAALLTLKLHKFALECGYILKDASAYNIAFNTGKAIFIDTLSFDFYQENKPWRAYKQFLMHFLAPLLLAKYHGASQLKLMSNYLDGIPLPLMASLLPKKTKLNPFLFSNIYLPAKFESKHSEDYQGKAKEGMLSKSGQIKIIDSLYAYIKDLKLNESSEWGNYYTKTNYSNSAFLEKEKILNRWSNSLSPKTIIDVGGNDGTFVRSIKMELEQAIVCDIDNNAVDSNFYQMKKQKETFMLPMVLDVLNPSPAIGVNNEERASFLKRISNFNPDVTIALAVIHHITLSGNVPFEMSAEFFGKFSNHLIIEFPKREDSWVQRLLNTKGEFKAHFDFYNFHTFETAYATYFEIVEKVEITDSNRVLYLLKRKDDFQN